MKDEEKQDLTAYHEIRDRIHNLDLNIPKHKEIYENTLYSFIKANEGYRYWVYPDPIVDKRTVGIGFNMDAPTAQNEWQEAFGDSLSFDDVLNGKRRLSESQVRTLFNYNIAMYKIGFIRV